LKKIAPRLAVVSPTLLFECALGRSIDDVDDVDDVRSDDVERARDGSM